MQYNYKQIERCKNRILNVFEPMENLAWFQVYTRLKLPVSRINWDYVQAWQDLKIQGILQECINNTFKKIA